MSKKYSLVLIALLVALIGTGEAKGPTKTSQSSKSKGYSGKGIPSRSKSSKSYGSQSRFPTQSSITQKDSKPYSRPTTSSKGSKPSYSSATSKSGGSISRSVGSSRSKYAKTRPTFPSTSTPITRNPLRTSAPVHFPSRPSYSKPSYSKPTRPISPSRPSTTSTKRPPSTSTSRPTVTSTKKPTSTPSILRRPPTIFYPRSAKKTQYDAMRASLQPSTAKPTRPTSTQPDRSPSSYDRKKAQYYGPNYPGLRPPSMQPTSRPPLVNRPTTVINQNNINNQVTNVNRVTNVNNSTNINNWFNGNSWRNSVTVNSNHWNNRPWWHQPDYHDWHHGHWNSRYYFQGRDSWSRIDNQADWLGGLVSWGLGNLVYRSGYQVYANPYYSRAFNIGTTTINYSQPISVQQSRYELAYESDEEQTQRLNDQAMSFFETARDAFRTGNTPLAYDSINRAIALMPDDTSLHEFRSLVLFSAGRYSEAAEAIHAVLAVAPGWDWTTMSGLYPTHAVYTEQLRRLEDFVRSNPRSADVRFLLAYHYITMGYPNEATSELQAVLILNPEDRLAADLMNLLQRENQQDDQFAAIRSVEDDATKLEGRWRAERPNGEIELELDEAEFKWHYDLTGNHSRFGGKYEITGNMMLLASEEGSQMIGTVDRDDNDHFTFRLLGSNDNDRGVEFVRR